MAAARIPEAERLDALRLIRTPSIGPIAWRDLIARFGGPSAALKAAPDLARRGGRKGRLEIATKAAAERELAALEALGGRMLLIGDPDYPAALAAIPDPPPALAAIGDAGLLGRASAAFVGARNASLNGRNMARRLAGDVSAAGAVVVSGLARGIDGAAHEGALDRGTVAVVAGGVDVVYPREHEDLQLAIGERGCVVAESALGVEPTARSFPRRNRIISGLALATIVVEAALRSGSLITARLAGEQGREVGAVPGSPLDPRAQGCNRLIKEGAALIETAADVVALLGAGAERVREPMGAVFAGGGGGAEEDEKALEQARLGLAELLSPAPASVDELLRVLQLSPSVVQTALLELELAGRLERSSGGRVALVSDGS